MTGSTEAADFNISVVIPSLDARDYLPPLLGSIEAQTLAPKEIVIVDSGPKTGTADLIDRWQGPITIVYRHVEFAYPGRARNLGVEIAKGEWIAFIDCRTLPGSDWLEVAVSASSRSHASLVRGLCVSDADTGFKQLLRAATYGNEAWTTLPGSLVRKTVFEQSGGFTANVRAGEDVEWMDRLESLGIETVAVPSPTIRYHGFPDSLTAAVRKWYVYAIANAAIEVRNNHKNLYLAILIILILFVAYRWNATFATDMSSAYYLPNVTKISMACVAILYMLYRGIVRPLKVKVGRSYLLPWRWLAVGFIGLCLDLAKAPGLIWGALMLLERRLRAAWVRSRGEVP